MIWHCGFLLLSIGLYRALCDACFDCQGCFETLVFGLASSLVEDFITQIAPNLTYLDQCRYLSALSLASRQLRRSFWPTLGKFNHKLAIKNKCFQGYVHHTLTCVSQWVCSWIQISIKSMLLFALKFSMHTCTPIPEEFLRVCDGRKWLEPFGEECSGDHHNDMLPLSNSYLPIGQWDLHQIKLSLFKNVFFFLFFSCSVGMQISRPYTVVLPSLQMDPSEREYDGKRFHLMIKLYPDGTLTPTLNAVGAGELSANFVFATFMIQWQLMYWITICAPKLDIDVVDVECELVICTTTRKCCYVDNRVRFHHKI